MRTGPFKQEGQRLQQQLRGWAGRGPACQELCPFASADMALVISDPSVKLPGIASWSGGVQSLYSSLGDNKTEQKNLSKFSFSWFQPRQFPMTSPYHEIRLMNYPETPTCTVVLAVVIPVCPAGLLLKEQDVREAVAIPSCQEKARGCGQTEVSLGTTTYLGTSSATKTLASVTHFKGQSGLRLNGQVAKRSSLYGNQSCPARIIRTPPPRDSGILFL